MLLKGFVPCLSFVGSHNAAVCRLGGNKGEKNEARRGAPYTTSHHNTHLAPIFRVIPQTVSGVKKDKDKGVVQEAIGTVNR